MAGSDGHKMAASMERLAALKAGPLVLAHAENMSNHSQMAACWQLNSACPCWTGRGKPCLYSWMSAATTVAALAIMRAAGIRHIIEEGREGGLSAYMYHIHGVRVTSVEYLPEEVRNCQIT